MKEALARAAAAHPELPAPDAAFEQVIASRVDAGTPLAELHVADLFLAFHASRGQPLAVAALGRLLEALRAPLRRTGADEQTVSDLLADLPTDLVAPREDVPPRLLGYSGKGPLGAWLRVVAVRTVVERRRSSGRKDADEIVAERVVGAHDLELELLRRLYAAELQAAFAGAFARLDDGQRLLLRQHHVDGLGIDRIAALHGIHRATAARRAAAAREALLDAVRAILMEKLTIGAPTFDSIVRLVRSEISIHLSRYV